MDIFQENTHNENWLLKKKKPEVPVMLLEGGNENAATQRGPWLGWGGGRSRGGKGPIPTGQAAHSQGGS